MELREVFEPIVNFLKNFQRKDKDEASKNKAKERLQLVLMQDRASVSPDFFEMMKKEIIDVIKKYIEIDEETLEVQLTRGFEGEDNAGPALYANIPIKNIKPVAKKNVKEESKEKTEASAEEVAGNIIEDIKVVSEEKLNKTNEKSNKDFSKNKNKKHNKVQAKNSEQEDVKKENIDNATNNETESKTENTDEAVIEEIKKESTNAVEAIETETANEETTQNENVAIKGKFNAFKEGASEKFSKMRAHAKDGFKKIKSKVKAKN